LPFEEGVAVKNTLAITRERWNRWWTAGAGPWGLSPLLLPGAALAGELATAVYLFASGSVSPVLVRSLQLFLRF
jgi:hypothetical protein